MNLSIERVLRGFKRENYGSFDQSGLFSINLRPQIAIKLFEILTYLP